MREATGTTWVFGLVTMFIFLFATFLILALNYSDVFRMKNDVKEMVEKYEGYTFTSRDLINNFLLNESYSATGACPEGYAGANLDGTVVPAESTNGRYNYCVDRTNFHYDIILFYSFSLPYLGDILTFNIKGETRDIQIGNLSLYLV